MLNFLLYNVSYSDCGDPAPTHGSAVTPEGTTLGEMAFISCEDGYTLVGVSPITCQDDLQWSSSPACVLKGTINDTLKMYIKSVAVLAKANWTKECISF